MTFHEEVNEALNAVREVRLDKESDEALRSIVGVLHRWQASEQAPHAKPSIKAIENEMARRHATATNKELISEQQRLHQEMLAETKGLKDSVMELKNPHWTMAPGFWVLVATLIFAAIAAWPVIRGWIPAFLAVDRAANFQLQQSNSVPSVPSVQKMSPVAPAAIQGTNQGPK